MPVPDYQAFMLPLLRALASGPRKVSDCLPEIVAELAISENEAQEMLPNGSKTLVADRAHWARTYLGKAGLASPVRRGVHQITDRGREVLTRGLAKIDNAMLSEFPEFLTWKNAPRGGVGQEDRIASVSAPTPMPAAKQTPDETIQTAFAEINAALADEVLGLLHTVSSQKFEQVVVDLLRAIGYGGGRADMAERLGRSGDGGLDGVIKEDRLGLDMVYIQAKKYAPDNRVGRPAVQAFVGSLTGESASKGVFVTTSDFSREARDYAGRVPQRIVLIEGRELARLMIEHEVGVRARQTWVRRSVDEDYFGEE